jgi:hypothetical protein
MWDMCPIKCCIWLAKWEYVVSLHHGLVNSFVHRGEEYLQCVLNASSLYRLSEINL